MWTGNILISLISEKTIYIKKEEISKDNEIPFPKKYSSELTGKKSDNLSKNKSSL